MLRGGLQPGFRGVGQEQEKLFAAAAQAHRRTGAPILTHTEQGALGLEQIARLHDGGEDFELSWIYLHTKMI